MCREQQICSNETTQNNFCDLEDITCLCGPAYRARTAACEAVTCSPGDRLSKLITDSLFSRVAQRLSGLGPPVANLDHAEISLLAQELCGPLYSNSSAIGSSVSSAIASATAAAIAAVASKDPTNTASYPSCAVCIQILLLGQPRFGSDHILHQLTPESPK